MSASLVEAPALPAPSPHVVLVGCSSKKLDHAAPARDLYTSSLFKKARAYAEALGCPWAILSAKYGLVLPGEVIAPYDVTLKKLPRPEREEWLSAVKAKIRSLWPGGSFTFLAGAEYVTFELEGARDVQAPLRGMGIGQRLAWLTRQTKEIELAKAKGALSSCREAAKKSGADKLTTREINELVEETRSDMRAAARLGCDVEPCDFCGEERLCAVSEQGDQRFTGDHTPARICTSCAEWALSQLRPNAVSLTATIGG